MTKIGSWEPGMKARLIAKAGDIPRPGQSPLRGQWVWIWLQDDGRYKAQLGAMRRGTPHYEADDSVEAVTLEQLCRLADDQVMVLTEQDREGARELTEKIQDAYSDASEWIAANTQHPGEGT